MTTREEFHTDTAHTFLTKARSSLSEGDLLQAAEKGWGAAAHSVKAAAEARGWRHSSHRDLFDAVRRLADDSNDVTLRTQFLVANGLHNNFYDGELPVEMIAAGLNEADEFVRRLDQLDD
ncbi:MAG: hypothetical protein OXS30_10560 [Chloroflexota bacterium]|nr:hypothetical protein [Chloroflexota bacterium]